MATLGTWMIMAFGWLATPIGAFFGEGPCSGCQYPSPTPLGD